MQKVPRKESIPLQKRFILYDLEDLYRNWIKQSTFGIVPSLSLFIELRPIQCVFAGAPGSHTVCVCSFHQNVKLKLAVLEPKINYKEIIGISVCSIENKRCMLRECDGCGNKETNINCIRNDAYSNKNIKYKQWVQVKSKGEESSTSKTTLQEFEELYEMFLDNLVNYILGLTEHHYISENQKNYFSDYKNTLDTNICLIVMDFAEKYSFICQDSTQGFYFNNCTASVHTMVVYYKSELGNDLKVQSYCIISNVSK